MDKLSLIFKEPSTITRLPTLKSLLKETSPWINDKLPEISKLCKYLLPAPSLIKPMVSVVVLVAVSVACNLPPTIERAPELPPVPK